MAVYDRGEYIDDEMADLAIFLFFRASILQQIQQTTQNSVHEQI